MATIAEEINDLKSRVDSAYDACEAKGATIPSEKTTWNLSSTIETIPSGGAEMPTFYGIPISAFLLQQDSNGKFHNPMDIDPTRYCLHITGSELDFSNPDQYILFKRYFGCPGDKFGTYNKTPILSVIWEPHRMYQSPLNFDYTKMTSIFNCLFSGNTYEYVSFPTLSTGYWAETPGSTTSIRKLERTFANSNIYKLDLPKYCGDEKFEVSGSGLRELYAPNLSSFGVDFLSGNSLLSSCTINKRTKQRYYTSAFRGCTSLSSFPIDLMSNSQTGYTAVLEGDFIGADMTSIKDIDLSAELAVKNQYYSFVGAFQNCTSLSSAKVTFSSRDGSVLSCSAGTQILSGMFLDCHNLQKVEINGITHFGSATGNNTSMGVKSMMYGTKAGSQLWFNDIEFLLGTSANSASQQKFYTLGCKDLYFPKVRDIKNRYVFGGLGSTTTGIHFPAASEAALKATTGWQYQWTAPATCTIYFDL